MLNKLPLLIKSVYLNDVMHFIGFNKHKQFDYFSCKTVKSDTAVPVA